MTADPDILNAVWQAQFKASIPESILEVREGTVTNNRENAWSNLGLTEKELAFANSWLKPFPIATHFGCRENCQEKIAN